MVTPKSNILIVIPAYNEEKNIQEVIRSIRKYTPSADIVVINDGSSDSTAKRVAEEEFFNDGTYLISLPYNMGIGAAIQTGFKFARYYKYDICVQCDGDGQHPAYQIGRLIKALNESGSDVIIGSRLKVKYTYKSTVPRLVGIYILAKLISAVTKQEITDPTIGFRAFNKKAIDLFSRIYPSDYPEPESLVLAYKAGLKVKEVPVKIRRRKSGISSINFWGSIYYMTKAFVAIIIDLFEEVT